VTMKKGVFWDVTPCGSCKNRRAGGSWHLLHQGDKNRWTRNNKQTNKQQTPWPLVRERTIPTERPPLVDEI
jgi:hypothetical protein